jgi:WD40 repeat protein
VKLWEVAGAGRRRPADPPPAPEAIVKWAAASDDGTRYVAFAGKGAPDLGTTLRVLDAAGREVFRRERPAADGPFQRVALSPDGRRVAWAEPVPDPGARPLEYATAVTVWDLGGGRELFTFRVPHVRLLAFHPDGARLAVIATVYEGQRADAARTELQIWDAVAGQRLHASRLDVGLVPAVLAFSPGGRYLAGGSSSGNRPRATPGMIQARDPPGLIRVWDTATGEQVRRAETTIANLSALACSPDGRLVAVIAGAPTAADAPVVQAMQVLDVQTGQTVATLEGHFGPVASVAFAPGGRRLATGAVLPENGLGEVKVWDLATGQCLLTLRRESGGVGQVAFSPDGTRLFAVDQEFTGRPGEFVTVWDATPRPAGRPPEPQKGGME